MSTIHSMSLAVIDMQEKLTRELQFSADAKRQIRDAFTLLRDALDNCETVVNSAIDERMRALSATIGTGKPTPETVENEQSTPQKKPKLVKASATEEDVA